MPLMYAAMFETTRRGHVGGGSAKNRYCVTRSLKKAAKQRVMALMMENGARPWLVMVQKMIILWQN